MMFISRMWSWVCLNLALILSLMFNDVSEARHTTLVGTVYCDPCFHQDFPKPSHFISDALVGVECGGSGKPRLREEVTTNEKGEFRLKLPFEPNKDVNEIKGCSVKLISSNTLDCPVAAIATSSSIWLKVKTPENHVFSAGSFTFQPLEQPKNCQIESHENSNDEYGASTTPESHENSNGVFGALAPFPSPVKHTAIQLDDAADVNDFGFPYDQFMPPPLVPSFPFQPPPNSMFNPDFQTPPDSTFTPNFQTPPGATFTPNFQTPPGSTFTPNVQTPPGSMFNPVPVQASPDSIFNPFQLAPPTMIPRPLTPPPPSFFPSFPFPPVEPQPVVIQLTPPPPSIPPPSPLPPPPPTTPPGIMPPFPPFPFQPSPGNRPGTRQAIASAHLKKT